MCIGRRAVVWYRAPDLGRERGDRSLPRRQLHQLGMPSLDFLMCADGIVCRLRQVQPRADRKVRYRERVSGDELAALEVSVQDLGVALEILLALFNLTAASSLRSFVASRSSTVPGTGSGLIRPTESDLILQVRVAHAAEFRARARSADTCAPIYSGPRKVIHANTPKHLDGNGVTEKAGSAREQIKPRRPCCRCSPSHHVLRTLMTAAV
jgi:hypothetical protein